jgi:hypothetical protein
LRKAFFQKVSEWLPQLQQLRSLTSDFGGFQSFVGEKEKYEIYEQEYVSSVATLHYAARILEIADATDSLPTPSSAFELIDVDAAQAFLHASRSSEGLYKLAPNHKRLPTVAAIYHGTHAWRILASRRIPSVKGGDVRATFSCDDFMLLARYIFCCKLI